jgi:hypothetical protein
MSIVIALFHLLYFAGLSYRSLHHYVSFPVDHEQTPVMQHNDEQSIGTIQMTNSLASDLNDETGSYQMQSSEMEFHEPMNMNSTQMTSRHLQFSHAERPSHGDSHEQVPAMHFDELMFGNVHIPYQQNQQQNYIHQPQAPIMQCDATIGNLHQIRMLQQNQYYLTQLHQQNASLSHTSAVNQAEGGNQVQVPFMHPNETNMGNAQGINPQENGFSYMEQSIATYHHCVNDVQAAPIVDRDEPCTDNMLMVKPVQQAHDFPHVEQPIESNFHASAYRTGGNCTEALLQEGHAFPQQFHQTEIDNLQETEQRRLQQQPQRPLNQITCSMEQHDEENSG